MYGAREEGRGGPTGRVYVADLQVIERNGDICIDFANIGFVNEGREDEGGRGGGDMKISIELTTVSFHVCARLGKCHICRRAAVLAPLHMVIDKLSQVNEFANTIPTLFYDVRLCCRNDHRLINVKISL